MLGYFVGEGSQLNTVLNLIEEKKYDEARMMRMSDLIAMPKHIKRVVTTREYE